MRIAQTKALQQPRLYQYKGSERGFRSVRRPVEVFRNVEHAARVLEKAQRELNAEARPMRLKVFNGYRGDGWCQGVEGVIWNR